MKSIHLLPIVFLLSSSCTSGIHILLRSNGTTQVAIQRPDDPSLRHALERSPSITHIDSADFDWWRLEFDAMDSIGCFVPHFNPGFVAFQDHGDSITVRTGDVPPFTTRSWGCCHLVIRVNAEYPIEVYGSDGKKIKAKRGGVWLGQARQHLNKGKKNIDAVIKRLPDGPPR